MKGEIEKSLKKILRQLYPALTLEFNVDRAVYTGHGEYSTAVSMQLAKMLKKAPLDIAAEIETAVKQEIESKNSPLSFVESVEVASPGFINLKVKNDYLGNILNEVLKSGMEYGKSTVATTKIMVEFAHPNTHKAMHIGHLRNLATGESIVRLLEAVGHKVVRANYQGDVGMHIAKCLYGISQTKNVLEEYEQKSIHERIDFLGKAYAAGSKAYEENEAAKQEILQINKKIYAKDQSIWELYQTTRKWSLDYFEIMYKRTGTHFDRYYFESEVYALGKELVLDYLTKGAFESSDGAIIFPGEKHGLHNRVFITAEGNPTYEGKEMGLAKLEFEEHHPDLVIHVVGPEQAGYFQVVFKAIEQIFPDTKGKEFHLIYGFVKLKHGKMSSRTGNVVLAWWLLEEAKKAIIEILKHNQTTYSLHQNEEIAEKTAVAAVKYSFLKVATKSEIAFDLQESVNFEGDSGPYLQYTYARCKSVLSKTVRGKNLLDPQLDRDVASNSQSSNSPSSDAISANFIHFAVSTMNHQERAVARLIGFYPEIVSEAATNYSPSLLCNYLFELAQSFNLFYAKHSILGNQRSAVSDQQKEFRLKLTAATAQVIKNGLYLLGIETLEQM